ncbi:MAG TPA: hypothetical protein PKD24_01360 [Pyrinomonadaceae bacterium]|nr:hypothetical protein [Pyrinomonadaceae bacterium]HMP64194.1 hypothetical protein [Pyrinomonadaceae bacterium]
MEKETLGANKSAVGPVSSKAHLLRFSRIWDRFDIDAFLAHDLDTKFPVSSFFGEHPLAVAERRAVPHMLIMPALEQCPPIAVLVRAKINYRP